MKFYTAFLLSALFSVFGSCKSDLKREVFWGLQLGSTKSEITKKLHELVNSNALEIYNNEFYYYESSLLPFDAKYFVVPVFRNLEGDSLIVEIDLHYFTDLKYVDYAFMTHENGIVTSLREVTNTTSVPNVQQIKRDILEKLITRYGKCTRIDTLPLLNGDKLEETRWGNFNDVEIEVKLREGKFPNSDILAGNCSLVLTYKYDYEFQKRHFPHRGLY